MNTIEQLGEDLVLFVRHLLSPGTLSVFAVVCGAFWKLLSAFTKRQNENQRLFRESIENRFDKIQKEALEQHNEIKEEILRLQILDGIDAKRLSASEVRYFYDKYKKAGGNSFVTEKVKQYLKKIERGNKNAN